MSETRKLYYEDVYTKEFTAKVLECRELHLALPGAEPADGLRTEPMMMARETAEIGLPGEIYTPLAMD